MRFLGWILIMLAVLEVLSIVLMADWVGGGITFLIMVLGFVLGVLMLRNIGFSAVLMAGESMRSRKNVSLYQLFWPIRFIVAGLLLMSPGFASDIVALVLMLPLKGKPLEHVDIDQGMYRPGSRKHGDVIEGEYTVSDTPDTRQERIPDHKR